MRQALLLLLLAPLALGGCDKAGPVAPEGSVLTISAAPNRITATGSSEITVTARKSTGFPVNPGTTVIFSTTRGSIPSSGQTNDEGVVRVLLSGNGEVGLAMIKANAGAAEEVMIEVQIGIAAGSITLQASPTSVTATGGTIELLAVVRDDVGQPLPGASVNFTSQLGLLDSGGGAILTDSTGEAEDVLRVRRSDLGETATSFEVGVEVPGADGKLITRTRTIAIQR